MSDVRITRLARRQRNRFSRSQVLDSGIDDEGIGLRVASGRWERCEEGVYGIAPVLEDDWGRWKGATLSAPETFLSLWSAGAAYGDLCNERPYVTVVRPGNGGPVRHGGLRVHRSQTLAGEVGELRGIPIVSPERTLIDLAPSLSVKALARAVREAVRLEITTLEAIVDAIARHRGRRGTLRLARAVANYAGLPLERARSGAEVRALLLLRDAKFEIPDLNYKIAGEEADLIWRKHKLIIEIDGGPFHLDAGEDARKQAIWERAGWTVLRISSDDVYERPHILLALAPRG